MAKTPAESAAPSAPEHRMSLNESPSPRRKRGPNVAGERARDHLLTKAVLLFGRHGYAGVSTREIAKEAGINQASIHYYFGSKRELYLGALDKYFNEIAGERYAMLERAESAPPCKLEDVLRALIEPHVRFVTRNHGRDYLKIIGTISNAPEEIREEIYSSHFARIRRRFIDAIARAEPGLTNEALHRSFSFVTTMMASSLFDMGYRVTSGRQPYDIDVDQFVGVLIAYNTAGIRKLVGMEPAVPSRPGARAPARKATAQNQPEAPARPARRTALA
jgi:AcrR family transcriptional regulator